MGTPFDMASAELPPGTVAPVAPDGADPPTAVDAPIAGTRPNRAATAPFRTGITLGLAVVLVVAAADIASSTQTLLALIAVGGLLAIAVHRPVGLLADAFGGRRGLATAVVCAVFASIVAATIILVAPRALGQAEDIGEQAPEITRRLGEIPLIGDRLADAEIGERLSRWFDELPSDLGRDTDSVVDVLRAAVNGAASALIVFLIVTALLLDGPRLVQRLRGAVPGSARRRLDRVLPVVRDVVGRYFIGSIIVALIAGLVVLVTGLVMSVPLIPLVAIWVTVTNLIPQIGGLLGGAAFVGFALVESPIAGVVCLLVFLAYQQLENHVIAPFIVGEAVHISPPVALVASLVGISTFGVLGAVIAVPLVGSFNAVAAELRSGRRAAAALPAAPAPTGASRT
jgi:putative heme transporter